VKARKILIGAAMVFIGLPVVLLLIAALSISILNRTNGSIVSSGKVRSYLLYVPESYDGTRATPLVISIHGAAVWPAHQMNLTRWNRLADEYGFIVVYPAGTGVGPRIWHANEGTGLNMDVRFISALLDTLESTYNIDPTMIYANGFSLGGGMAFVLSCTLSERIAAVGMVAAAQTLPWSWCTDERPVPMITFHGTADLVPYEGGPSPDPFNPVVFPSVLDWTASWARRNQCGAGPSDSVVAADVMRRAYAGCARNAAVVLFTIEGGGHQWPGGKAVPEWLFGSASHSIDATREMWAFFLEHQLVRDEPRAR